jgi:decaprenylphospho-beta-D-ribofuranose 2-oxidase
VRGGGQALDGQALNDDIVILLDRAHLDWIGAPRRDDQGHYITVGAGAAWGEILAVTTAQGLVPYSVVTSSRATAGGTLSSDCLSRCSPITGREGQHVRSFKLLTADGRPIECRRDDPDPDRAELFHAVIGGLGYLGIITEVTFDLRPPVEGWAPGLPIRALTHVTKLVLRGGGKDRWRRLLLRLRDAVSTAREAQKLAKSPRQRCPSDIAESGPIPWDAVSGAAWFAGPREEALLFRSRYVVGQPLDPLPLYQRDSAMALMMPEAMLDAHLTELGERAFFLFLREGCYINEIDDFTFFMENQFGPQKASANRAGWRLNVIQQTFVLPSACTPDDREGLAAAATFLAALRPELHDRDARPTLIDVIYLPADSFALSANRAMCGFAVTLAWTDRDGRSWGRLSTRLRELSGLCRQLGGRVHLVKSVEAHPDDLAAMYRPVLGRFLALKKRCDPRGILRNEFFDRVVGAETADPRARLPV